MFINLKNVYNVMQVSKYNHAWANFINLCSQLEKCSQCHASILIHVANPFLYEAKNQGTIEDMCTKKHISVRMSVDLHGQSYLSLYWGWLKSDTCIIAFRRI